MACGSFEPLTSGEMLVSSKRVFFFGLISPVFFRINHLSAIFVIVISVNSILVFTETRTWTNKTHFLQKKKKIQSF